VIAESKRTTPQIWRRSPLPEASTVGIVIGSDGGVLALWSCAAQKIADAERLLAQEKM
jgi:hypothetical protein